MENECRDIFEKIARENEVKLEFEMIWVSPAVKFDHVAVEFLTEAIKEVGYETALINGAKHDRCLPLGKFKI